MLQVTRASLEEEVRQRTDLPAYGSDSPITQTEIALMVEKSLNRLGALVNQHYGEGYFTETATLTTSAGFSLVSLPQDFETLLRVSWARDSNSPNVPLSLASVDDWDAYPSAWGSLGWGGCPSAPMYRLGGSTIELFPTPDAAYTLSIHYTTQLAFSGTTPAVQLRQGWEDWIVCDVAIRVRQRQQKDASEFTQERMLLEDKIIQQAKRDNYSPRQIRDVRSADRWCRHGRNRWG